MNFLLQTIYTLHCARGDKGTDKGCRPTPIYGYMETLKLFCLLFENHNRTHTHTVDNNIVKITSWIYKIIIIVIKIHLRFRSIRHVVQPFCVQHSLCLCVCCTAVGRRICVRGSVWNRSNGSEREKIENGKQETPVHLSFSIYFDKFGFAASHPKTKQCKRNGTEQQQKYENQLEPSKL